MSSSAGYPDSSTSGSTPRLDGLGRAIDSLAEVGVSPAGVDEAVSLLQGLDRAARRLSALQVSLMDSIDQQGLHQVDGHANVKVMARHLCGLSGATAAGRARSMKVLRELPEVAHRFAAGEIGIDQVNLLGRVHANSRVVSAMADNDDWFCRCAVSMSFRDFEAVVRRWERLVDQDGPEPASSRAHEKRNARLTQDPIDLSWELIASYAAMQGAAMNEVFDFYVEAELAADWEKARAEHGEGACYADLPRTVQQRRADALWQIFQDAAAAEPGAVPPGYVHNIVWDAETFEQMASRLGTADEPQAGSVEPQAEDQGNDQDNDGAEDNDATVSAGPDAGTETDPDDDAIDSNSIDSNAEDQATRPVDLDAETMRSETVRCQTIDGVELDPVEAITNATVAAIRRVIVDAKGVTIDLDQTRLFTGNARHAVHLADSHCVWPGCQVPARNCETDHLTEHSRGGSTNPGNGAVMCGRHNRWKQKDYTVHRDQTGQWHTYRPNGQEIP